MIKGGVAKFVSQIILVVLITMKLLNENMVFPLKLQHWTLHLMNIKKKPNELVSFY